MVTLSLLVALVSISRFDSYYPNYRLGMSHLTRELFERYLEPKHWQASTLTQNDTGPVGPVTPSIYWSCKIFTGPAFFL